MDFGYLLRLLARRKWLILGAMLTAAVLTFILIGLRAERYKSSVIVATGIVNYKGINSDNSDAFVQQYQIENAFSNLTTFGQSRSSIKILTIKMLQHDLSAEGSGAQQSFRKPNIKLIDYTEGEKQQLLAEITKINLDSITTLTFSPQVDYLLDKVSRAYGYDHDAILRSLAVKRKAATDYLEIEITTEDPKLSQYMADAYVNCFMTFYHNLKVSEKRKNVESYMKLANEKMAVVDSIVNLRFEYLRVNRLPVLGRQGEELVGQITKLEIERQRASSRKQAAAKSVEQLGKHFDDRTTRDAGEVQGRIIEKNSTAEQAERVRQLNNKYLESEGKDIEVAAELAEAKEELESAVRSSARVQGKLRTDESKRTREELYKDKVATELDKIDAEEDYSKLNSEIRILNSKLAPMALNNEVASKLGADEVRAQLEFDNVNEALIKAKLELENTENSLSIVENAQLPEWPEPNRRTLISVFSAIVIGTLTTIAIFVLAFMDSTLQSPDLFKRYSNGLPLLGVVSAIPVKGLDLNVVFTSKNEKYTAFRESLRKLRTQILGMPQDRIWLFVSIKPQEGKTFNMLSLAHSLGFNNKKILLLDTNFKNPIPEAFADEPTPQRAMLNQALREHGLAEVFQLKSQGSDATEHMVDILGNTGIHRSPSELLEPETFKSFLADLRKHYDYIFMEAASMHQYSDTQELVPYCDKVIAVFNAGSTIKGTDKERIEFLKNLGSKFGGSILTQVEDKNNG